MIHAQREQRPNPLIPVGLHNNNYFAMSKHPSKAFPRDWMKADETAWPGSVLAADAIVATPEVSLSQILRAGGREAKENETGQQAAEALNEAILLFGSFQIPQKRERSCRRG